MRPLPALCAPRKRRRPRAARAAAAAELLRELQVRELRDEATAAAAGAACSASTTVTPCPASVMAVPSVSPVSDWSASASASGSGRVFSAGTATASRLAAQQLAAGSREQALTVDFDPTACPPWASLAHSSHDLLWLGGFLFCGNCGSTAVTAINSSKLVSQCCGQFTVRGRQVFTRLCGGKIPHGFSDWPDGGASLRDGAEIKRVRQLA